MKLIQNILFVWFVLSVASVIATIDEKYKKDIFDILTNAAFEVREAVSSTVHPDNVTFSLFKKDKPLELVKIGADNIEPIDDASAQYVFVVHGWLENREKQWYEDLKNAFLNREGKFNVIQVDWSGPALEPYSVSSTNTRDVGKLVGDLIVKIHKDKGVPIENFHIVGHSLGGQVAGFAGKTIFKETGKKLPRITALDPAGPYFIKRPTEERLNQGDADVVAVIHTDGGKFGFKDSVGTLDFFPNGGSNQPGCAKIDLADVTSVAEPVYCDHQRSWHFFIEAVLNPDAFVAKKCKTVKRLLVLKLKDCQEGDTVNIGDLSTRKTGDYYLETNSEPPYGKKKNLFDISRLLPKL